MKNRVRELRKALGIGQIDFAIELGIRPGTYMNNEKRGGFSAENVAKICTKYPEFTLWLMTGETNVEGGQISPSQPALQVDSCEGDKKNKKRSKEGVK